MIDNNIGDECCGCKMCGDICPTQAISFETNSEGFWHPKVDYGKCVNCSLCVNKCPVINQTINQNAFTPPKTYAAWLKDDDIRIKSTSGGLYYALAQTMLAQGGYISGCVFSDDWKFAKHIVGNTQNDLDKLFRSKYFQSDTSGIYSEIKRLLDSNERLLFCGTPCHNAALIEFLGKDYVNLIQCDFICRGINSPLAHRAHVAELEKKYNSLVTFFNFKNKSKGWTALGLLVKFANGKQSFTDRYTSAWTRGYIGSNLYMRRSCEECRFKRMPRVSDITFGDYWGLQKDAESMRKGFSVVMLNTDKGIKFYNETLPLLHSEDSTFEQALKGNTCIFNTPKFNHEKRDEFFRRINNGESFSTVVFDLERTNKVAVQARSIAKKLLAKLPKSVKGGIKKWIR